MDSANLTATAVVVAAVASLAAWFQVAVARRKLKLEFFEYRYLLFELLRGHMFELMNNQSTLSRELFTSLSKFHFLFDQSIADFATEVHKRGALHALSLELLRNQPTPEHHAVESANVTANYGWLQEQTSGLRDRFKDYLDFKGWS